MAFDWGGTGGAVGANIFYTLVYDESDEISRPPARRSENWKRAIAESCPRCSASESGDLRITVRNISGHFYVLTKTYP
jgi:hypothetical protein